MGGAEKDVLRFSTLQHGPLQKSAATAELYLRALAYARRTHTGLNPLNEMFRVKLFLHGARRGEGPPNRKLPLSRGDLIGIHDALTPGCVSEKSSFA